MELKEQLIKSIASNLKIELDVFSLGMIEECIDGVGKELYTEFYNMLMGDDHDYLKPLDRVAKVSKHFKHARSNELFAEAHGMAKAYYSKFYDVNASMTTYSQENRNVVKDDRKFFTETDYSNLRGKHGEVIFSDKELYVLDELGGGEWLMNIKFITNAGEAVAKIEKIIKNAITLKHLTPKHEAIDYEVRKRLR